MIARETLEKLNVWDVLVRVSIEKDRIEDEEMLLVVKCGKNRFDPFEKSGFTFALCSKSTFRHIEVVQRELFAL